MSSKIRIALGFTLILVLAIAVPVFAGGWAIITLDELPTDVVAGEPLAVGFTVLQHGETPMTGLNPTISASIYQKAKFVADAKPDGKPGHYTATLTFPTEGNWEWSIQAFTMNQKMPTLNVAAAPAKVKSQPVVKSEPVANALFSPLIIARASALGIGLISLVFVFRRRSRLAMVVTGLCLLVGVGSFAVAPAVPAVEAQSKSNSAEDVSKSYIPPVEMGRQLFIAKGCITCHANEKAVIDSDMASVIKAP
ncbi:MAG: hypothetical protein R3307_06395, partial [Anaerolineales bacterium]|nr:hypothetical protein [Anaerolineales bacterium]